MTSFVRDYYELRSYCTVPIDLSIRNAIRTIQYYRYVV